MDQGIIEVAIGLCAAIAMIMGVRALRADRVLILALITLPSIYAAFALIDGDVKKAGLELLVGLPFLMAGVALFGRGTRLALGIAGAFWIAHGLFDAVREDWLGNDGVPGWYPAVCLGVDLATGAYLLLTSRRSTVNA